MASVTKRISEIKQPRGGFVKPSDFQNIIFDDGMELAENENLHATVVGLAVDYLTRFMYTKNKKEAFRISLKGAETAYTLSVKKSRFVAKTLLRHIKGLDSKSIISACKLVTFDTWYRDPMAAMMAKRWDETNPDNATINNIRIMVNRGLVFFSKYGPVIKDGFTFEPRGYTATVNSGDGDFLTADTLWDFKVSKAKPTNKHTLQLLMYWIMGQHSGNPVFRRISKLGIFNPRLNAVYLLDVNSIPQDIIQTVERDVIRY